MILTNKQKAFIIKNKEKLEDLFKSRIEELKEEASLCPRELRDQKLDVSQELRLWLRDIRMADKPERDKPDNLI
jgi:hypothetical protein